jgi:hypothetical protein
MVDWFLANYEDPAESTPYCSAEGGYQYLCGGPYAAREEIDAHFQNELTAQFDADELEEIIDAAVDEIEQEGVLEWAKPLADERIPLLRAHPHRWGLGHVHQFDVARGRTLCGKTLEACPGVKDLGDEFDVDCKACLRVQAGATAHS